MDGGYSLQQMAPKIVERKNDMIAANDEGAHGSSTLLEEKAPKCYAYYWNSLWTFFENMRITKPQPES
jgi:hypothetical protein